MTDAPLTPEPLDAKALAAIVGCKPATGVRVYMHGDRLFWRDGDLWYDYGDSAKLPGAGVAQTLNAPS